MPEKPICKSDTELLGSLLRDIGKAERLIEKYRTLAEAVNAPRHELQILDFLTATDVFTLKALPFLANVYLNEKPPPPVNGGETELTSYFVDLYTGVPSETVFMLTSPYKNGTGTPKLSKLAQGVSDSVSVMLAKILALAASNGARSLVIAHNHPNTARLPDLNKPSDYDVASFRRLGDILEANGISLLGYYIVSGAGCAILK